MFRIVFLSLLSFSLVAQINSPYDEQNPVLHPSKNEIYFTIAAHPLNVVGKRDAGDIWVSKKEGDKWGLPAPVKGLINNAAYNSVLGFSEDGEEMYLFGHYTSKGDVSSNQGISVSKRNGDTWSGPVNKSVPYFMNKSVNAGGHISDNIFVFSGEGRSFDSFGNEDLYVCFNRDGLWTEPLNLGNSINTAGQELSPYYHAPTNTLFFSSNRPGGMGSFDVYSCERLDDTWQKWSTPKNEGASVNSSGRELYFRLVTGGYVFTTNHNSDGYGDIRELYYATQTQDDLQTMSNVVELHDPVSVMPSDAEKVKIITLTGRIVDAATGQGISATIAFKPQDQPPVGSSSDGQYKAFLPLGLDYSINIGAPGYIALDEPIRVADKNVRELEINFKLQPVAVGVSVNLKHVLFRQSSPELLPESYDELDRVIAFLNENPTVVIELSGHTDDAGKAALNLKLSRDRVARVKNYLTEKGIVASRVRGVGYGETKPIASNKTDEGRKMNRRVEFKIVKK
jgi:OOP family OmpA-OmpF porin